MTPLRHVPRLLFLVAILSCAREGLSAQTGLREGVSSLADQISESVSEGQAGKLAVVPFRDLSGGETVLGHYIAEALITRLVALGQFDVMERAVLDRILEELRLGESGLIDPNTAKEVGQVAGADAVVTGTITEFESFVSVNSRLVNVATGRVFAAAETEIVKDEDVRRVMDTSLSSGAGQRSRSPSDNSDTEPEPPTIQVGESQFVRTTFAAATLFLDSCSLSESTLECELQITNETDRTIDVRFWIVSGRGDVRTFAVGADGESHPAVSGVSWFDVTLPSSVRLHQALQFDASSLSDLDQLDSLVIHFMGDYRVFDIRE